MPFTTHWVVNNRIIADRIDHNLTPELQLAQDKLIQSLLEQSERPQSHIILDCTNITFPTFRKRDWVTNAHLGWIVFYGVTNPLFKISVGLALKIRGIRHHFADNADDALKFLHEVDISLPKAKTA